MTESLKKERDGREKMAENYDLLLSMVPNLFPKVILDALSFVHDFLIDQSFAHWLVDSQYLKLILFISIRSCLFHVLMTKLFISMFLIFESHFPGFFHQNIRFLNCFISNVEDLFARNDGFFFNFFFDQPEFFSSFYIFIHLGYKREDCWWNNCIYSISWKRDNKVGRAEEFIWIKSNKG